VCGSPMGLQGAPPTLRGSVPATTILAPSGESMDVLGRRWTAGVPVATASPRQLGHRWRGKCEMRSLAIPPTSVGGRRAPGCKSGMVRQGQHEHDWWADYER